MYTEVAVIELYRSEMKAVLYKAVYKCIITHVPRYNLHFCQSTGAQLCFLLAVSSLITPVYTVYSYSVVYYHVWSPTVTPFHF